MNSAVTTPAVRRVAMLGNHLPRQCGIATFTTHLSAAIEAEIPTMECPVLAMNDAGSRHIYPGKVCFEIAQNDIASYRRAADYLNVNSIDLLSVQHEYGIFGGRAGSHLLVLLRELRMPIVTTLHTILSHPDPAQARVMNELVERSQRLVVMTMRGATLLHQVHGVPYAKIDQIPHGIPDVPATSASKERLGVVGRPVLFTFGLLSPDKGIENVIDAMPAILARHPEAVYIVLGATHPHVREREGETYRIMLENRSRRLGVDANLIFHDRFVSQDELNEFLAAADIYITPYLQPQQITSGTLAYALGAGKAVVSTPYLYACDLLADGRGILVPWRDPDAIAREVIGLLDDAPKRLALSEGGARFGRSMRWPVVARRYAETFDRSLADNSDRMRTSFQARTLAKRPLDLPEIDLGHLRAMTDDTGVLQHAAFSVPRYEDGYCLDDNARALLLTALLADAGVGDFPAVRSLSSRYLAFIRHAYDAEAGRFRNLMSYSREWVDACGSEDSHARALWALGTTVGRGGDPGTRSLGSDLFHSALPAVHGFSSPRAWAYVLLGIEEYLRAFEGDTSVQGMRGTIGERLLELFRKSSSPDWPWFEDRVTYCNARLSQALLVSGFRMGHEEMIHAGLRSLEWLVSIQRSEDGYFAPVGSNGFYERGGIRASFDQQPVEACAMISACLDAHRLTGEARWAEHARCAFDWFLGQNQLQQALYDVSTGGCRDGLHADRLNENQGAESTLSFLLALAEMRSNDRADLCLPAALVAIG